MNFPFHRGRQDTATRPAIHEDPAAVHAGEHVITSDFSNALCRFVLDCTCGAHFDTPYIDEALEYREMHARLAPLADQLKN